jgi:hypothetical protein
MNLLNFHNQLMRVKKIDTVKVDAAQFEVGEGLSVEEIGSWWVKHSIIQTKAQNSKRQSLVNPNVARQHLKLRKSLGDAKRTQKRLRGSIMSKKNY